MAAAAACNKTTEIWDLKFPWWWRIGDGYQNLVGTCCLYLQGINYNWSGGGLYRKGVEIRTTENEDHQSQGTGRESPVRTSGKQVTGKVLFWGQLLRRAQVRFLHFLTFIHLTYPLLSRWPQERAFLLPCFLLALTGLSLLFQFLGCDWTIFLFCRPSGSTFLT